MNVRVVLNARLLDMEQPDEKVETNPRRVVENIHRELRALGG